MTSQMIEVKTAELEGVALDWAVGISCDQFLIVGPGSKQLSTNSQFAGLLTSWSPSTNWVQGGPLIAKYRVSLIYAFEQYEALIGMNESEPDPSPLIAACRAIVASKLGETVSIPRELLP